MATPSRDELRIVREPVPTTGEEHAAALARLDALGRELAAITDEELCKALEDASEEDGGRRKRILRSDAEPQRN